jgi:putative ABC transport system permease protein
MPDWKDMSEEIAQHLEDRYRELRAAGVPDADARRAVAAEIDGSHRPAWFKEAAGDLRFGVRSMRKQPLFAAVVVATLALGIGANAAIFTVVDAVVLRPLPYRDADRLVVLWGNLHRPGLDEIPGSAGEFVDYRSRVNSFEQVAAYDTDGFNLTGGGEPERIEGAVVTPSLFPLLGASAALGRTFVPDEERPGRAAVIVISHSLWTRRFGADRSIAGRTVTVDRSPVQVVGVMPADFHFPDPAIEMWKPIVLDADAVGDDNRGSHGYTVLARLRTDVSLQQAEADVNALAATFKTEHPNNYRNGFSVKLRRLQDEIVGDSSRALFVLMGAVALVLLIACANVATLQLARSASRRKELALRTALGAKRSRLVRQLLTESLVFAAVGGVAGLLFARWAIDALVALAPTGVPRLSEVGLDHRVVAFTATISVVTGLLFGTVPAVRASGGDLNDVLKEGGRSGAPVLGRTGRLLVIAEVALSLVLLIAAGLLMRSFARIQDVPPGFDAHNLVTFRLSLPSSRYTTFRMGEAFFDELFGRLQSTPSVVRVAAINALPFSGSGGSRSFNIEGRAVTRPEDQPEEQLRIATEGYFDAMRIPLLNGRDFSSRDTLGSPRVAVVNQAFARKHFPDGRAIGARLSFSQDEPRWYEIVGLVGNVKHRGLDAVERAELYVSYRQPLFDSWTVRPMSIVVRTATDPAAMIAAVRRDVAAVDPEQPISDVQPMDARIDRSLTGRRFNLMLLGVFATFALTLAAIGIYAIVAYSVAQRTHEIGVRLALGAQRNDVLRLVVMQAMSMTAAGAALGLAMAVAVTHVMSSLLFGVSAVDPATFALIPLLFFPVAFAACYLPALRATRVNPIDALRIE